MKLTDDWYLTTEVESHVQMQSTNNGKNTFF